MGLYTTMLTIEKIQLSENQLTLLHQDEVVEIEASWDEFLDFKEETDYPIIYQNGKIIVMGKAKYVHEWLVMNVARLLSAIFWGKGFDMLGSNIGISIADKKGYYNPDVTVVKGRPMFVEGDQTLISNPYLLVEVISASTAMVDFSTKSPQYRKLESLHYLVFVNPFKQAVHVLTPTEDRQVWQERIYDQPTDQVMIDGFSITVNDIFENMPILDEKGDVL